jgi:hypothetical protein
MKMRFSILTSRLALTLAAALVGGCGAKAPSEQNVDCSAAAVSLSACGFEGELHPTERSVGNAPPSTTPIHRPAARTRDGTPPRPRSHRRGSR